MRTRIGLLTALMVLALPTWAQFSAPTLTRAGRVLTATTRWEGDLADLPPAAIVEETLEGPWNLTESALPDDATPVSRVASSTRATIRALTLVERPGKSVTRRLALPPGTRYTLRIPLPFVGGCDARYAFRLPSGMTGRARRFCVRLGDALPLCETDAFGRPGAPTGIRYAPAALGDGRLVRFITEATDTQGREFTDEDWFIVYQRGGQTHGFSLPLLAGTTKALAGRGPTPANAPESGIRAAFLRQLREATTFTFALHGAPDAVAPTLSRDDPQLVSAAEMALESARRSWRPPLQLVFADSCSTLAGGARAIPAALGITDATPGRAYIGFDAPAVVDGKAARLFWEAMRAGKTVREAVSIAQDYYDVHCFLDGRAYPATLRIVGDPEARLNRLKALETGDWWELLRSDS